MQILNKNGSGFPIKAWIDGVQIEHQAHEQLRNVSNLPFIYKWVAAMPDVHAGKGATIGSVIPTKGAVIPAAVGVDIGCGMVAVQTNLSIGDIPENIRPQLRANIEATIPTGRTCNGGKGDRGAWDNLPSDVAKIWRNELMAGLDIILGKNPKIKGRHGLNSSNHLGTLGTGNHFIEICIDLEDKVWVMLHSGSRGVGNRLGQYFINLAKSVCQSGSKAAVAKITEESNAYFKSKEFRNLSKEERQKAAFERKKEDKIKKNSLGGIHLPNSDLAYFEEGTQDFDDYMEAVLWAQKFAKLNRELMMNGVIKVIEETLGVRIKRGLVVNCHHNYIAAEEHYGEKIFVTRKGAIRARKGDIAIIPGSMGAKSYIVEGLGNEESFCSASHGAGRKMSRTDAKKTFTVEDHIKATEGVECLKDASVLDETPLAYKSIDKVMEAEKELVKPIYQLHQIICIKGA